MAVSTVRLMKSGTREVWHVYATANADTDVDIPHGMNEVPVVSMTWI